MKDIKILIAAHKDSELPNNKLFLPIEVGAANRAAHLEGYQKDDEGENISQKNQNYCELTAIYWGWKNLDCDYCGICHYRRFFSFADAKYKVSADGRRMIRLPVANQDLYEQYGLLDEKKMREIIEKNDLIVAESQNVREILTPRNKKQRTVYGHYRDHENCIIKMRDVDLALEIAKKKFPELSQSIDEYMNQKWYLGYNMWIAKKNIYNQICDFMFSVLFDVEKQIDTSSYGLQMSRVYGYLAEILSSIFIYHLRKDKSLKVNERQMIYIETTDKVICRVPKNDVVPIIFDLTTPTNMRYIPLLFAPAYKKFLDNISKNKKYEIFIFYNSDITITTKMSIEFLAELSSSYSNCKVEFIEFKKELLRHSLKPSKRPLLFYIPQLYENFSKLLYFSWNTWIKCDVSKLFDIDIKDNVIAAVKDIFREGQINDIVSTERNILKENKLDAATLVHKKVLILNPKKMNQTYNNKTKSKNYINKYQKQCLLLPQKWNFQVASSESAEYIISMAPAEDYKEYCSVKNNYCVASFPVKVANNIYESRFSLEYYEAFKDLLVFPLYQQLHMKKNIVNYDNTNALTKLIPEGSPKRERIAMIIPRGSVRRKIIDKVYFMAKKK